MLAFNGDVGVGANVDGSAGTGGAANMPFWKLRLPPPPDLVRECASMPAPPLPRDEPLREWPMVERERGRFATERIIFSTSSPVYAVSLAPGWPGAGAIEGGIALMRVRYARLAARRRQGVSTRSVVEGRRGRTDAGIVEDYVAVRVVDPLELEPAALFRELVEYFGNVLCPVQLVSASTYVDRLT